MNSNRRRYPANSRAFTLIELLTVIAIIGILTAIIIPVVGSVRESARASRALSNAKQIGMANLLFAQDNKGRLLGEGWVWNDTNNLWNNIARYLDKDPGNTATNKTKINAIIADLIDPSVPENLQRYGANPVDSFLTTWSVNSIFNVMGGRVNEGLTETRPSQGAPNYPRRRLLLEFSNPARTVYMVSGSYQFNTTNATNKDFRIEPEKRQPIFYLYGGRTKTPAVFLDGHAAMLTFPISPSMIVPTNS
jgi:prepilin-type N-terminal cleavage/methylation domain-containing protein